MMRWIRLYKVIILLIMVYIAGMGGESAYAAENIDPGDDDSQYAYGENVGWLNFEPGGNGGPGVEVTNSVLTGYIWAENIGWVNLSCLNAGSCSSVNCGSVNFGVCNNGSGLLSGYAWGENVGWVNFAPNYGGVSINPTTGAFSGKAWGENIGWISLSSTGPVPFAVKTFNTLTGADVVVPSSTGVTITFSKVTIAGTTTVTTSPSSSDCPKPKGFILGDPPTYYEITSNATFTDSVEICINYGNQFTESQEKSLELFHCKEVAPGEVKSIPITKSGYPKIDDNIICGTTDSFSPFFIAQESPTAVTLSDLYARLDGNQVVLTWSTSSETNNEGFTILRAESANGAFTAITSAMIPAMGGMGMRATYTFTDSNIEHGKTYYYRLQDIDTKGVVTAHNVAPVTIAVAGGKGATGSVKAQRDEIAEGTDGRQGLDDASQQQNRPTTWMSGIATNMEGKTTVGDIGTAAKSDPMNGIEDLSSGQGEKDHVDLHLQGTSPGQGEESLHAKDHPHPDPLPSRERGEDVVSSIGPSSFSVTIEDRMGNLIKIKRMEGASPADSAATPDSQSTTLKVSEESGHVVVTWHGAGPGKGFVLYRTEKGKENYVPISGTIPYFGKDGKERYRYLFIDKGAKSVKEYEYRLEIVRGDAVDKVAKQ